TMAAVSISKPLLKLKHGTALDLEEQTTVDVTVTATDSGGLSVDKDFTVNIEDVPAAIVGNNEYTETITGSHGIDIIRPGQGADTVDAGGGNDFIVVVGDTRGYDYTQADIDHPTNAAGQELGVDLGTDLGSYGIDLNSVVSLASLNDISASEAAVYMPIVINNEIIWVWKYDAIDGGEGTDYVVTYGTVDFTNVTIGNARIFEVQPTLSASTNRAPTAITLDNTEVTENIIGDVVGNLTVVDPNTNDTHTFSVNDDRFEVASNTLKLKDGQSLDYETNSTIDLVVTAKDNGGLTKSQVFTITVQDQDDNDAPTDITLDDNWVEENKTADIVGNLTVTDSNPDDTHTFSVDDARFEIIDNKLKLRNGVALDYEVATSVDVAVTATDSGGLSFTKTLTVNIQDLVAAKMGTNGDDNIQGDFGASST
ncbi:hypothetical protein TI03_05325, partial [Achromatium sp. WMS1]